METGSEKQPKHTVSPALTHRAPRYEGENVAAPNLIRAWHFLAE